VSVSCAECAFLRSGEGPRRDFGAFVVHGKLEGAAVPGWLVIAPVRHVESLVELSVGEAAELGMLVQRCVRALTDVTPTAKAYVASFNEVLPHLHVHVIARPPDGAVRGPAVFGAPGAMPERALVEAALARI
jgi:diadenosine tetraphosphate (Ap4A) HIT family hydrolase